MSAARRNCQQFGMQFQPPLPPVCTWELSEVAPHEGQTVSLAGMGFWQVVQSWDSVIGFVRLGEPRRTWRGHLSVIRDRPFSEDQWPFGPRHCPGAVLRTVRRPPRRSGSPGTGTVSGSEDLPASGETNSWPVVVPRKYRPVQRIARQSFPQMGPEISRGTGGGIGCSIS